MKHVRLFEGFLNESYWETQVGDFLKSNGRNLETKNDLKDADIEKFVNAFEMKYKTQPEIHDKIVDHVRGLLNYPGDGKWIDPAGGIHDDDEEDPAKMYEDNSVKAKDVMTKATPEQRIVLNDFQAGTEFFFFDLLRGEITPKSIDDALQLMVNTVEGDESQLEPEHAKYAEIKGWLTK